ncbi:MAG: hypothetical protein M1399_00855 [Actinobacteria bacterium]|jgi:hypothetical protein|nr:hypothetical protein [Actinomycetota bacterium]
MNNTYRQTKNGEWVVMGDPADIRPGGRVTVTKKDGTTKTETIVSVGETFNTDKGMMVYGYLTERKEIPNGKDATPKQRATIERLLGRLSRIQQFDSFGGSGEDMALSFRKNVTKGLSKHEASNLIEDMMCLINDEM